MKSLLLAGLIAGLPFATPVLAAEVGQSLRVAGLDQLLGADHVGDQFDRRGRGRGRGGRDGAQDDDRRGGGHGGRPRVPGGSGCDDPGDIAEHPECRA